MGQTEIKRGERTPGPWKVKRGEGTTSISANGFTVAVTYSGTKRGSVDVGGCEANAEYIVRMENCFEELVAILKEGSDIISGLEAELDNAGIDMAEARDWWRRADDLLAKAVPSNGPGRDGASGVSRA